LAFSFGVAPNLHHRGAARKFGAWRKGPPLPIRPQDIRERQKCAPPTITPPDAETQMQAPR